MRVGIIQHDCRPCEKRRKSHSQGMQVMMEAEVGGLQLPGRAHLEPPEAEETGRILPGGFRGSVALLTP